MNLAFKTFLNILKKNIWTASLFHTQMLSSLSQSDYSDETGKVLDAVNFCKLNYSINCKQALIKFNKCFWVCSSRHIIIIRQQILSF